MIRLDVEAFSRTKLPGLVQLPSRARARQVETAGVRRGVERVTLTPRSLDSWWCDRLCRADVAGVSNIGLFCVRFSGIPP